MSIGLSVFVLKFFMGVDQENPKPSHLEKMGS